ncbi:MAG: response regulator [Opitutaceae bacterium]|jgi:CheY-like chemotaxis protein
MLSATIDKTDVTTKTRRVLYVDDMRELREVAHLALSSVGHRIDCVADGTDAFERVAANPGSYDIVITDHHMAGLNGIGLVIKLREIGYPGRIAIVSSELNREVAEEYRQLGVNRILYKPVELADLRALVLED